MLMQLFALDFCNEKYWTVQKDHLHLRQPLYSGIFSEIDETLDFNEI